MSEYKFTVRASDTDGAFSDREFSLNVVNTEKIRFVAISKYNTWVSPNGMNWQKINGVGGDSVSYGDGKFFIVNDSKNYYLSDDGIIWNKYTLSELTFGQYSYSVTKPIYVNGKWFAIMQTNSTDVNNIYSSTDGIKWDFFKQIVLSSTPYTLKIVSNGDICLTNNGVLYPKSSTTCYYSEDFSSSNPTFIDNTDIISTSVSQNTTARLDFNDIKYLNGIWLSSNFYVDSYKYSMREYNPNTPSQFSQIRHSFNGKDWYQSKHSISSSLYGYKINGNNLYDLKFPGNFCYGNGIFLCSKTIVPSYPSYVPENIFKTIKITSIARSTNGEDWEEISLPDDGFSIFGKYNERYDRSYGSDSDVAFSNGTFVLVGPDGIYSSNDGISWNRELTIGSPEYDTTDPLAAIAKVVGIPD